MIRNSHTFLHYSGHRGEKRREIRRAPPSRSYILFSLGLLCNEIILKDNVIQIKVMLNFADLIYRSEMENVLSAQANRRGMMGQQQGSFSSGQLNSKRIMKSFPGNSKRNSYVLSSHDSTGWGSKIVTDSKIPSEIFTWSIFLLKNLQNMYFSDRYAVMMFFCLF